jgi:hypothetical protein
LSPQILKLELKQNKKGTPEVKAALKEKGKIEVKALKARQKVCNPNC